jgi:hypothetical protein
MMLNIDLLHHRLHVYLRHLHRLQQQDIQLMMVLMLLWLFDYSRHLMNYYQQH